MGKKIVLILMDSFMPHVLQEARQAQLVPTLSALMERGAYWDNCVSAFPTMSANVDASLSTGAYSEVHGIPGLVWYSRTEKRVVNYINGNKSVLRVGIKKCAKDVLVELNEKHLSKNTSTLFEELAQRGKTSASINFSSHRGPRVYRTKKPGLSAIFLAGLPIYQVTGPEICTIGRFIDSSFLRSLPWNGSHTIFYKYGLNDSFAIRAFSRLVRQKKLPQVSVIYLPDMDYSYHRKPDQGPQILAKVDRHISRLLESFGGIEAACKECRFILVGDHGQTKIGVEIEATINVEQLLQGMKIARMEQVKPEEDDLVICNNERACYFYPLQQSVQAEVVKRLLEEPRIDVLAWKEKEGVRLGHGKQTLFFALGRDMRDEFGKTWKIEGDLSLIDAVAREHPEDSVPVIFFGKYPDILSRLYGALYAQKGEMIVATAEPGCEFFTQSDPVHRGGASHGSLHETDSLISLIITDESVARFKKPRIVDLKSYILQEICNIES
ncbi:alkaline phosphatase family protein [Aneurinibacillus sp. REN35]|uniref:alkaline phosphatase family protein n=1 Tax=Aneurinibacillus sp. REN35 TaxID=3237286 RepID=UPI003528B154